MPGYVGSVYAFDVEIANRQGSVSIADWQLRAEWYRSGEKEPALILRSPDQGIAFTNADKGKFHVEITNDQTTDLGPGTHKMELWLESDGKQVLIAHGFESFEKTGQCP